MDEGRFAELDRKRFDDGLTDQEADELGRLMAEREGKPYHNADERPSPEEMPESWRDEAAKQQVEGGEASPVDETEMQTDHKPEEERAVGMERQPATPGYLPPQGGKEPPA